MSQRGPWFRNLALSLLAGVVAAGCSGAGGCGGCGATGGSYVFPADRVQSRIAKGRITRAGIDFLRPRLKTIIQQLLGVDAYGRVSFNVPEGQALSAGNPSGYFNASLTLQAEPNGSNPGVAGRVSVDFSSLNVELLGGTPPKVRLSVRDALVDFDVRVLAHWQVLFDGDAACYLRGDVARGTPQQRALLLDMDVDLTLEVGPNSDFRTQISFPTLTTRDLNFRIDSAPSSDPYCADGFTSSECTLFCGASDLAGNIATGLRSLLGGVIDGALRLVLPPIVQGLVNGQPLKFQGQVDLGGLLGGLLPSLRGANPLGYLLQPGPDGFVVDGTGASQGLNLALNGGLESSPQHPCVPRLVPLPSFVPGSFPALSGVDPQNRTYHVALTLSEAFLDQGGVAAYTSGALCLNVGSQALYGATGGRLNLSAGALALLVPGLRELATNDAPVMIGVQPTSPPAFKLGSGTGEGENRDSLLNMELKGMHLSFYALVDDRMTRLFEFNADIYLGLTIVVLPDDKLQVAIDKVKIDKLTETYNELFRSADLQSALRLIVNVATSALLGQGLSFDVDVNSALPGPLASLLRVQVNEIMRDGAENDYLTLALTFSDPSARPQRFTARTRATLVPGEEPMAVDLNGRRFATGRLALDVSQSRGRQGDASDLEFQVRLDGGPWSGFSRGPRLYVDDPRLLLIGEHTVEVRSRVVGAARSLDAETATLRTVVDPLPPRLSLALARDAGTVRLDAEDEHTPRERLTFSWRMDGGAWSAFVPAAHLAVDALPAGAVLEVRAADEAGNVSDPVATRVRATHGRTDGGGAQPGCGGAGCSTGHGGGDGALWLLAALGLLAAVARRPRRAPLAARLLVVAALLPAALLALGCSGDSVGNTCTTNAQCLDGFRCVGQKCEAIPRCDDPSGAGACCPGQVCSAGGTCVDAVDRCDEEGQCASPGKTCSGRVDGGVETGICSYKTCTADGDCAATGASCFNGYCRLPTPCDGGCEAGEVCVTPTDECVKAPAGCQSQTCGVGQLLVFDNPAAQIGARCDLAAATCRCADIPQIPAGDWGRDSRIAVLPSGAPVVSAYDKTYGDLVLARYSATGALEKLEYVDGVPSGERPTGRPTGIRGGVTAPGANVGRHTSVAVSMAGTPIISYYDVDNADLKFAAQSGTSWSSHVVDAAGDVGRYTHLVVGPNGRPHIAYFQKAGAGADVGKTALKVARAKTATPGAASDWDIFVVDTLTVPGPAAPPCGGACAGSQVCIRVPPADGGAATQRCATPDAMPTCAPACPASQACVAGACEEVIPAPPTPLDDLPEGVGLFPSLAVSSAGVLHVAYYDRTNGNLKGARASVSDPATPADWQKSVIDGAGGTFVDGDVGLFPSLGFLPDGKLVIAYEDATNDDLVLYVGAGFTGGQREVIDRGQSGNPLSLVGADAALAVAPGGGVFVAYQDATFNDLKLARRTAPDTWSLETVLAEGAWGFFADLAIAGNKMYISSLRFGFDENAQPRNELRVVVRTLP